jgi:hypothetical protein
LTGWHRIAAELDWDRLPDLLAENVVFHSPATFEPRHGKAGMAAILPAVLNALQDFTYLRHFGRGTGYVLEFSARVGDESVLGVDLIEFNQDGKITDFAVMMRPATTVLTLASEAAKRLAAG